jgi:hypothetical protein
LLARRHAPSGGGKTLQRNEQQLAEMTAQSLTLVWSNDAMFAPRPQEALRLTVESRLDGTLVLVTEMKYAADRMSVSATLTPFRRASERSNNPARTDIVVLTDLAEIDRAWFARVQRAAFRLQCVTA